MFALLWGCSPPAAVAVDPGVGFEPPPTATSPVPTVEDPEFACFATTEHDLGQDGTIDGTRFAGYDEAHPERLLYRSSDDNGNGLREAVERYEYDATGAVTRYEREYTGPETITTDRDARGNALVVTSDAGSDGVIEAIETWTYDPNDLILSYAWDASGNGTVDYTYAYTRTAEGLPISAEVDDNGDGEIDTLYTYAQDALGRQIEVAIDDGLDGEIDTLYAYTYTDPVRLVGTVEITVGGEVDQVDGFEYDDDSKELYFSQDLDLDGTWDYERATERDEAGRALAVSIRYTTDRTYLQDESYAYDALGRTLQSTLSARYDDGQVLVDEAFDTTFGGSCP